MEPILSAVSLLAVVLLVLAGAWLFTRWAGRSLGLGFTGGASRSGRIRVLDRADLGRERTLLVVRAGQRYLLLGSTSAGLSLLAELSREEGELWEKPPEKQEGKGPLEFTALMQRLREKK